MLRSTVFALLLAGLSGAPVHAQDGKSLQDRLAEFSTDLAMPASPAAAHVGLSSEGVLMPRNRREFEAGLTGLLKDGGQPAGAIEFSPYYIARGGRMSFSRYRRDGSFRALTKTSIGFASGTREVGDRKLSARGLSLSSVLVDLGDPVYSHALQLCINRVQAGMLERARALPPRDAQPLPDSDTVSDFDAGDEFQDEQAVTEYARCVAAREPELWNRSRVSVGVATGRGRESADPGRRIDFGTGFWVSAQYGFESWSAIRRTLLRDDGFLDCALPQPDKCGAPRQPSRWERSALLTLHARRTHGASDLDLSQTGELRKVDSSLLGARFTYGSASRSVFAEASRSRLKGGGIDKRTDQQAFGASFKVGKDLWLNAVNGRRTEFADGRVENRVDLNLQWGFADQPLVAPR